MALGEIKIPNPGSLVLSFFTISFSISIDDLFGSGLGAVDSPSRATSSVFTRDIGWISEEWWSQGHSVVRGFYAPLLSCRMFSGGTTLRKFTQYDFLLKGGLCVLILLRLEFLGVELKTTLDFVYMIPLSQGNGHVVGFPSLHEPCQTWKWYDITFHLCVWVSFWMLHPWLWQGAGYAGSFKYELSFKWFNEPFLGEGSVCFRVMNLVSGYDLLFCHDCLQDLTKVDKNYWRSLVFCCLNFLEVGDEAGRVLMSLTIGYNHSRSSLPNGSFWSRQSVKLICKAVATYHNRVTFGDLKSSTSFVDFIGNLVAASNEYCVRHILHVMARRRKKRKVWR
ncbi:hypothetical protein V6N13_079106 [Hibiscus sabdariffa]|uniref:Uncharacterized protein n=1 Tax=Hibiscus sabdariffa TaxID=183260 RepID=A0ABR2RQH8_9ROSI